MLRIRIFSNTIVVWFLASSGVFAAEALKIPCDEMRSQNVWGARQPTLSMPVEDALLPITEVPSIYAIDGSPVSMSNIKQYIEIPLRSSIVNLIEKNIDTFSASANKHHLGLDVFLDGKVYSSISIVANTLSANNRAILQNLFPTRIIDERVGKLRRIDTVGVTAGAIVEEIWSNHLGYQLIEVSHHPGTIRELAIYIPFTRQATAGDINEQWSQLVQRLTKQEKKPLPEAFRWEDVDWERLHERLLEDLR